MEEKSKVIFGNVMPDKVYKKALTAPTLNKPAKTKFKSKDIFMK